jgi:hypothetical protein
MLLRDEKLRPSPRGKKLFPRHQSVMSCFWLKPKGGIHLQDAMFIRELLNTCCISGASLIFTHLMFRTALREGQIISYMKELTDSEKLHSLFNDM